MKRHYVDENNRIGINNTYLKLPVGETAKEMFRSLGYRQIRNDESVVEYVKIELKDEDKFIVTHVCFYSEVKVVDFFITNIYCTKFSNIPVSYHTYLAVSKQIEELDWSSDNYEVLEEDEE